MRDRRRRLRPALAAAAVSAALVLFLYGLHAAGALRPLERLEWASEDLRFRMLAPTREDPEVVLVMVDRASLAEESTNFWPWPRAFYGNILRALHHAGARAVFFDFEFASESLYSHFNVDMNAEFSLEGRDDEIFASALKDTGIGYLALLYLKSATELPPQITRAARPDLRGKTLIVRGAESYELPKYQTAVAPVPNLLNAASGAGGVTVLPDPDGIVRRVHLLHLYEGEVRASSHLMLATRYFNTEASVWPGGEVLLGSRSRSVPIDAHGQMALWWYSPDRTWNRRDPPLTFSAAELNFVGAMLFFGETPECDLTPFKDKVVLVGSNVEGLYDLKPTPYASDTPGVIANAVALENILAGEHPVFPSAGLQALAAALFAAFLSACCVLAGRLHWAAILFLLSEALLGWGAFALFEDRVVVQLVLPATGIAGAFVVALGTSYWTEGRQRRYLKSAFSFYLAPAVVEAVTADPDKLRLGGERREVTVYFSDVAGFTSISEAMDPVELVKVLNEYLSRMTNILMESGGTLDKYIGDAIMTFWGAPLDQDDHAVRACWAALDCRDALRLLSEDLASRGLPVLRARAGINTGIVVVGNMGSDKRFNYTVMGDSVNLAARLEPANKNYDTELLISESCYEKARDYVEAREVDLIAVKGKARPVRIYELMARKGGLSKESLALRESFGRGLEAYRGRDWNKAMADFRKAMEIAPGDGASIAYLERCRAFIDEPPPPDWDGVYRMTTK